MAKATVKKKTAKPAAKKKAKPAAKKPAARTVKKAVAKSAKKKPALKKLAAKKPVAKKSATPAAKKPVAKKPVTSAPKMPAVKAAVKAVPTKGAGKSGKATGPVPIKMMPPTGGGKLPPKRPKYTYKPVKLPTGYKPTEKEDYMSPQQLEYFRQKLLGWRKELIEESRETLDHLHEEDWHQADIADRASLETEAGVELRTRNRYLKLISKIDAALRRIEEGEYGYCEETGEPIGIKRLEARPVATLSIEAQERHEKMERQYTDED